MTAQRQHTLVLERIIDATLDRTYLALATADIMKQWFAPALWSIVSVDRDLRVGGSAGIVLRGPEGEQFPNPDGYLELIPGKVDRHHRRLPARMDPERPTVHGRDRGAGRPRRRTHPIHGDRHHWTEGARTEHEQMGFHQGGGQMADQLNALLAKG
jgi:uncharacterized protein YndB with AHSA1/START domain